MKEIKTEIKAEIVADSTNPQGDRITTYLLTFPRFILAELNTHRVFSKNSASSRAIPFRKMVRMVETDPFIPIAWQKDHKGMQGNEYLTYTEANKEDWLKARDCAVEYAENLNNSGEGVTKQICNRLLEPFMWHTVLLTGTEFENFFNLRCPSYDGFSKNGEKVSFRSKKDVRKHFEELKLDTDLVDNQSFESWQSINTSQAEIHIQALAEAMWDAMNESTPKKLKAGEWHIPFGDQMDDTQLKLQIVNHWHHTDSKMVLAHAARFENVRKEDVEFYMIQQKISTARCARLSYMTFDGEIDYEKDIKLHDTLLESQHMSPFEHCAKAMSNEEYETHYKGILSKGLEYYHPQEEGIGWCNNYKGFIQYRYLIENGSNIK